MPASPSVDTDPAVAEAKSLARRARYDAQKVLWGITNMTSGRTYVDKHGKERTSSRLAWCSRLVAGGADGVTVLVSRTGTGSGFSGLQTCGSVWACPVCSEKINAVRQAELTAGLNEWLSAWTDEHGPTCQECRHQSCDRLRMGRAKNPLGGAIVFGTFTVQHDAGTRLADLWDAVSPAWNRTTSGAGVAWNGSKRKGGDIGDRARFGIAGYVRLVENKYGDNGPHLHVHALFFLNDDLSDAELEQLRARLYGRWSKALGKKGFRSMEFDTNPSSPTYGQAVGVDLRRVRDAEYIADYFAKNGYRPKATTAAAGAAYEVTGSHSKRAGKGGRTPFEVLAELTELDAHTQRVEGVGYVDRRTGELLAGFEQRERWLAIWHEWERVSQGRRQLTWSRGMRAAVVQLVELTDEEIAEQQPEDAEPVWTFTAHEWVAGRWAYRRAEVLEAGEAGTLPDLVRDWLASRWSTAAGPPGPAS